MIGIFVRRVVLFIKHDEKVEKERDKNAELLDIPKPKKRRQKAPKDASKSIKSRAEAMCKKAESKMQEGKDEEAIKYFVQALALDPSHIETQHKLAMLYVQKQMYGSAAALFKSLAELTGEAIHYSHLGLAFYNQKLFEDAIAAYQKAVEIDATRPQRFASLARVYRETAQLQEATVALNKALELDPENQDFLLFLADLKTQMGNFAEAKIMLNKILEKNPEHKEALEFLKTVETEEKKNV